VELSWWGSAYATGYEVQRASSTSGPFSLLATVDEARTYTDTPSNGTWYYRVVAIAGPSRLTGTDVVRATLPSELWMRLPLNEGTGTKAADASGRAPAPRRRGGRARPAAARSCWAAAVTSNAQGLLRDLGDSSRSGYSGRRPKRQRLVLLRLERRRLPG
jgi:hypothetical protein